MSCEFLLACVLFTLSETLVNFWVPGQLSLVRPDFSSDSEKITLEQDYGQLTF